MARRIGKGSPAQPFIPVSDDKIIIVEMRVCAIDAVDLFTQARTECLFWVKTPHPLKQALSSQNLVEAGNAPGEMMRRVEKSRIGIRDLHRPAHEFNRDGLPGDRQPPRFSM